MTTSTEASKSSENNAILRELDELMEYMDTDENQETEELIDPSFFIGNMSDPVNEDVPDVPTLTTVASEPAVEQNKEETAKQPGLFSARVERFKQEVTVKETSNQPLEIQAGKPLQKEQPIPDEFAGIVDELVAENMPKLEAQLREKITAYLQGKKGF